MLQAVGRVLGDDTGEVVRARFLTGLESHVKDFGFSSNSSRKLLKNF